MAQKTLESSFSHLVAAWDITKACNFHCVHCISGASKKWLLYQISTNQALAITRRIGELGISTISWSGGEPLMRDDLEEIMSHGQAHGVTSYDTVTNGYFLTEERLDRLVEAGLSGIQISIDGINAEENVILRKGPHDCFSQAIKAIQFSVARGLSVVLGTMLYPEMIPHLDRMYDLAGSLGVDMLRFSGFVPNGRGELPKIRHRMKLSEWDITQFLLFIRKRFFEKPGFLGLDYSFSLNPLIGSFWSSEGRNHFFIDHKGDVFPSTGSEREEFKVGNVLKEDLADILMRPHLQHAAIGQSQIEGICRSCDKFDDCGGGPRGISFMFSGKRSTSPELCLYHEYRKRSDELGDPSLPRMLSSLDQPELEQIRSVITRMLTE